MKFCSNCKKEIAKENNFCPSCGKVLEDVNKKEVKSNDNVEGVEEKNNTEIKNIQVKETINAEVNIVQAKESNPLAIAGFVISLISLFCCGSTSFLGLIFSIVGLVESKKKNNAGKGLAIAGIVISAILLFLLFIFYLFYAFIYSASLLDTL